MILRKLLFAAGGAMLAALASVPDARADDATVTQPVVSAATEASHVICASECALRSLYVTIAGATSGFIMTFNAASVPADGAVTSTGCTAALPADCLRECVYIAGPNTVPIEFLTTLDAYNFGITAVFSTTGCFTKTASASAFFRAALH